MFRFTFTPTLKNYATLHRYARSRGYQRWMRYLMYVGLLSFLVIPFIHDPARGYEELFSASKEKWPLLFFAGLYSFFEYVAIPASVAKRFRSAPEVRVEREYTIGNEGFQIKSELFNSEIKWNMFTFADKYKGTYYFRTGQQTYFYFPDSLITDKKAFFELVKGKVKMAKQWKQP